VLASDFAGFDCWMVLMILLGSDLVLEKKKKKKDKKMICWVINLIKIYGQRNVDIFF
jgi:hypothetical protein